MARLELRRRRRPFGNRYDDPNGEYRVLYASTERRTTFRECLARFRPDPAIVAAQIRGEDDDEPTAPAGTIRQAGWSVGGWARPA